MLMPGGHSFSISNPQIQQLFYHALRVQYVWVMGLAVVAILVMVLARPRGIFALTKEVRARSYLRWAFGLFWLFDGLLQHQGSMPLGLANQVVAPAAVGAPFWLHRFVLDGVGLWNRFPISLAAATMWIQIGIGLVLLSSRGPWSRVAGAFAAGWGLLVWVVGNGMGGLFSPASSFLFGWPGAVAFYVVAGVWLAVSPGVFEKYFSSVTLRILSVVLALAVLVQVWPSHGFWHGGPVNPLHQMTQAMTASAQPGWLASIVNGGGRLASLMGGGLNLVVVFWLIACAVGLWRSSTRALQWPVRTLIVGCVAIWVVAQDAAIFGGLSTDVNSMLPLASLAWCAAPRRRELAPRASRVTAWWAHDTQDSTSALDESLVIVRRIVGIVGAGLGVAMILVALVPMGRAMVSSGAETTMFLAQNSQITYVTVPAPGFSLTNQHHQRVAFPSHDGRYTVLAFLDPRCWTDCPLISHQLEDLSGYLTPKERSSVQFVAVAADPYHEQVSDLNAFITRNYLAGLPHFSYVTGKLSSMERVWADYDIQVSMKRSWRMSIHSDIVYIVGPTGNIRVIVPDDPVGGWSGELSSAEELLIALHHVGLH